MDGGTRSHGRPDKVKAVTEPFIASESLARGVLSRHQLRAHCSAVFPDVYLARRGRPTLEQRIVAAWLWSHRRATIAGAAAAALHGAKWIDENTVIELVHRNARPPRGVLTRRDTLLDGEVMLASEIRVTTPERTAFDIARRAPRRPAVAQLDALMRVSNFTVDGVSTIAGRHRGARGCADWRPCWT